MRLGLADDDAVRAGRRRTAGRRDRRRRRRVSCSSPQMIRGNRELIAGVAARPAVRRRRDARRRAASSPRRVADVVFRPAPLDPLTAAEMIDELATAALLGPFRGEAAVDRAPARRGARRPRTSRRRAARRRERRRQPADRHADGGHRRRRRAGRGGRRRRGSCRHRSSAAPDARAVPRPVRAARRLVAGASTHPGKFGFVSLHNLLASGYEGRVFGTNLQGEEVLGIDTVADVADLPDGVLDLVVRVHAGVGQPRRCCGRARPRASGPRS